MPKKNWLKLYISEHLNHKSKRSPSFSCPFVISDGCLVSFLFNMFIRVWKWGSVLTVAMYRTIDFSKSQHTPNRKPWAQNWTKDFVSPSTSNIRNPKPVNKWVFQQIPEDTSVITMNKQRTSIDPVLWLRISGDLLCMVIGSDSGTALSVSSRERSSKLPGSVCFCPFWMRSKKWAHANEHICCR